jgi:hypothetical protein
MSDRPTTNACDEFRGLIHDTLDGELMEAEASRRLHVHLASCEECRGFEAGLRRIQFALRGLDNQAMPDEAFDEVLDRTVRARGGWSRALDWRAAAAAAILILATWNFWPTATDTPTDARLVADIVEIGNDGDPTEEELRQAAAQLRMILNRTGDVLERSGQSCRELLGDQLSPALQRLPIQMPTPVETTETGQGKSKT